MNKPDYYIFYHNYKKLTAVLNPLEFGENYKFVDLNDLKLPSELIIPELDYTVNQAVFSEYLGILLIEPTSDFIGCFTYSIQTKFSASWALESGNENFFPPIDFKDLELVNYDNETLYAVELVSPNHMIPCEMSVIRERFPLGCKSNLGPFKGSFVISLDNFKLLQSWLWDVTIFVINNFKMENITKVESSFDKSKVAGRTAEERAVDELRHTYGSILERAVAYFLSSLYRPNSTLTLGHEIMKRKRESTLIKEANKLAKDNNLIIAFGNFSYKDVALAWLAKLNDCKVENYIFISLDSEIHNHLIDNGFNSVLHAFEGELGDFWVFRLKTINSLIGSGLNIVHSDADAFWIDNPLDEINSIDADIISSQGSVFPQDVLAEWGLVLCCGFQVFRSTLKTLALFESLIPLVEEFKDDQMAINRLLKMRGLKWSKDADSYRLSHNNLDFQCFRDVIFGQDESNLKVALLPHSKYQRYFEGINKDLKVLHLLSDKTQDAKLTRLKEIDTAMAKKPKENSRRSATHAPVAPTQL